MATTTTDPMDRSPYGSPHPSGRPPTHPLLHLLVLHPQRVRRRGRPRHLRDRHHSSILHRRRSLLHSCHFIWCHTPGHRCHGVVLGSARRLLGGQVSDRHRLFHLHGPHGRLAARPTIFRGGTYCVYGP